MLGDKPGAPHPEQIVETWGDDAMAECVLKAATSPTSTASYPQTEAQRLEARMVAQIGAGLEQQKDFILRIVAGVIAEERADFAAPARQARRGARAAALRPGGRQGLQQQQEGRRCRLACIAVAKARIMTTRADMVREIRIAARVAELRRVAEDASEHYQKMLAASGLPREHFNLRMMLLGRLLPPPRKGGA